MSATLKAIFSLHARSQQLWQARKHTLLHHPCSGWADNSVKSHLGAVLPEPGVAQDVCDGRAVRWVRAEHARQQVAALGRDALDLHVAMPVRLQQGNHILAPE